MTHTRHIKALSNQYLFDTCKSIKPKFEMPEIFKWKPIGRYVSGSPLLDITAFFRATNTSARQTLNCKSVGGCIGHMSPSSRQDKKTPSPPPRHKKNTFYLCMFIYEQIKGPYVLHHALYVIRAVLVLSIILQFFSIKHLLSSD